MEDKLKELEKVIGTDSFNRVLRIMSFIGAKFPDEIDDLWKEEVNLVFEQDANQKGYLYFSSDCVEIKVTQGDICYDWFRQIYENGDIQEQFSFGHDHLIVDFYTSQLASFTSSISLYEDGRLFQEFKTDICSFRDLMEEGYDIYSKKDLKKENPLPIADYYDRFVSVIKSERIGLILRKHPKLIEIIIGIFGNLIKALEYNLNNNDLDYLFENEEEKIKEEYDNREAAADRTHLKMVKKADDWLENMRKENDDQRDKKMKKLEKLREKYKGDFVKKYKM